MSAVDAAAAPGRGRGPGPQGDRLGRAPRAHRRAGRHPRLRLAGDAQGAPRARAAAGRDGHADHVHADVHLPLRWRDRRLHRGVPRLPRARHPGADDPVHHGLLGRGAEHGHDQGRGRPVPLAADLARRPAGGRAARRQRPLRAVGPRDRGARPDPGLPPRRRRGRGGRRDGARDRVRLRHVVDLHQPRPGAAHAQRRAQRRVHGRLPADLHVQHLRRGGHPPAGPQGGRGGQPDLDPDHRHARPDGRELRRRRHRDLPRRHGGPDGDLRPDHRAAVRPRPSWPRPGRPGRCPGPARGPRPRPPRARCSPSAACAR